VIKELTKGAIEEGDRGDPNVRLGAIIQDTFRIIVVLEFARESQCGRGVKTVGGIGVESPEGDASVAGELS